MAGYPFTGRVIRIALAAQKQNTFLYVGALHIRFYSNLSILFINVKL